MPIIKKIVLLLLMNLTGAIFIYGQHGIPGEYHRKVITSLIDQYAEAREKRDTVLLKKILTADVDQLVSTGEWRNGIGAAVEGMLKSSAGNPGTRALHVEKIRMFNQATSIVDCRYEIQNRDGSTRKMWSTFLVVDDKGVWKISAVRNMLPASQ